MTKPEFVYVTYIETTPEKLWRALTEPAFTKRYWGGGPSSDWKVGSSVLWQSNPDGPFEDFGQVVIEADPYTRLSYSWQLTVVHDGFEDETEMLKGIRQGWPQILSNLKTMLEKGETLEWTGARRPDLEALDRQ
jgi:uncharacterized protein YndB with AHSA1/START domain